MTHFMPACQNCTQQHLFHLILSNENIGFFFAIGIPKHLSVFFEARYVKVGIALEGRQIYRSRQQCIRIKQQVIPPTEGLHNICKG